jgi:hypothetical protein
LYSVQSLQLHRPVVGVGAYVYPDEPWWGLTWWVGAPMWLWIDSKDPLQWGTHTLNPSAGGLSLDVTITAKQVRYDPGDGSRPVVCNNAGTPRPWAPDDLMRQDSPTWCQHKYLKTSELGNVDSRYVISATVVWDVVWSASDGDYGRFTVEMTSVDDPSVHVGELVAVIVPDPRRQKPTSTPT